MKAALHLLGGVLLLLTGCGGGLAVYWHQRESWQRLRTFTRLLWYLQNLLQYQNLPVEQLLAAAAQYPDFAPLGLTHCQSLAELPIPTCMEETLRSELTAQLADLGLAPRRSVCTTLQRLCTQCEQETAKAEAKAGAARQLYPRLGACAGILVAILLL